MPVYKKLIAWATVAGSTRMLVGSTSTLFLISRGLPFEQIILLKGLQSLVVLITEVPIGYLADRVSRRASMLAAVLCASLWMGITAYSPTVAWLFLGEVFNALAISFSSGATEAVIIDAYKTTPGRTKPLEPLFGEIHFIKYLGIFAAITVGSLFAPIDSPFFWWVGSGILMGQLVFFSHVIPKDTPRGGARQPGARKGLRSDMKVILAHFTKPRAGGGFTLLVIAALGVGVYFQIIIQYWQVVYKILLDARGWAGNKLLFGAMFACIIFVQAAAGLVVKKLSGRGWVLKINTLLFIAAIAALYCGLRFFPFLIVIALILLFFSIAALRVIISSTINTLVDDRLRASCLSFISSVLRGAVLAFALVVPVLLRNYGFYFFVYAAIAVCIIIITVPLGRIRKRAISKE